ncbi:MAG: hypothetical protein KDA89_22225 [Planctomycetaceae bacterium]|nr:hypothetical protein [Planctomycetaceae bacterium]
MFTRNFLLTAALLMLIMMPAGLHGCGQYGTVNSATFQHAMALSSACNSRRSERLNACANAISQSIATEEISSTEAKYLRDIIVEAEAANWSNAQEMARRLMADQAER